MNLRRGMVERRSPVVILMGVVALLAASLALASFGEFEHQVRATDAVNVQAHILADTVTAALDFGDRPALQEYVNALRADREVDAVGVFDRDGHLVAGFTRSVLAKALSRTTHARDRIIVLTPVMHGDVRLGTVYLRDRAEPLAIRLGRYLPPGLLVLMASLMFVVMSLDAEALRKTNRDLETQIAEREKVEAALRQSQKMEAVGRLTGGIAHDFNNMLAIVIGGLDLMLRRHADADPKMLHLARQAMEGANRAAALTQRLLAFSRQQPLKPTSADIGKAVNGLTTLLRRTLGETVAVETVVAGGLWRARIDLPQLESAIVNLAINARDASATDGRVVVRTELYELEHPDPDLSEGSYVQVSVSDNGVGMPEAVRAKAFDPFFTTKPVGKGTGLGLSQVYGFARQLGGAARIKSREGEGSTISIFLPCVARSLEMTEGPPAQADADAFVRGKVLVVDDDAAVRLVAVDALEAVGHEVSQAADGFRALAQIEASPPDVLVVDYAMAGMTGAQLAAKVSERWPEVRILFVTGFADIEGVQNLLGAQQLILRKPYHFQALVDAVAGALGARRSI